LIFGKKTENGIFHSSNNTFNQPIDNLPDGLETLILSNLFNQRIDHLPRNLKNLILGNSFNQRIDRLPEGLENIKLGKSFNRKITINSDMSWTLPFTLKKILLYNTYPHLNDIPSPYLPLLIIKNVEQNQENVN